MPTKFRGRFWCWALLLGLGSVVGCEPQKSTISVRLATTTSTHNSGLLDFILPPFEESSGIQVEVLSVGTGQALALGERGDVDLVLVHAREREDRFVAAGAGIDRRDIMWNDFVILGPSTDPAAIRGVAPAEALRRIQDHGAIFVSRGDDSGTHIRERSLWTAAGREPPTDATYLSAGQGMGACLMLADQKRAYLLSDRGTYLAFDDRIALEVLVQGGAALRNPYGAIRVNPQRHPGVHAEAALRLLDYLTSSECQTRIGSFEVGNQTLFHPVMEND